MQADGAINFAAAAEQVAEGELGFKGVFVEFGDVQEQFDGFVGLFAQEVIEATEIGGWKLADLVAAVALTAAPADDPAA